MPRKPILETINFDHIRKMAEQGMSRGQIGSYYGITGQRIGQLIKENPELELAFESGLAKGIEKASDSLMKLIEQGNVIATLFFLKSQAGWIEAQYRQKEVDKSTIPTVTICLPHNQRDNVFTENNHVEIE